MGVKELWPILSPVKGQIPLTDLTGQTIAVDLSVWIVETQTVKQMQGTVTKGYLRNLFFRCSHLMMLGVQLVFVVEGDPPEVKWEAMMKRQQIQGGGGWCGGGPRGRRGRGGATTGAPRKMTRSHFNSVLKECCEMLDYLGIPYVQSCGEAEGTCARLDALGLVDACMTNDGDAFLYGAKTVYRNFTMDRKDPHVEKYTMSDIEERLGLNNDRLVALALLLGCDYVPKGVPGVGKEIAMRYMKSLPADEMVLSRFRKWKSDSAFSTLIANMSPECRSAEMAVRQKAIQTSGFPFEKVIKEFMGQKENPHLQRLSLKWKRPKMFHLLKFQTSKLEWVEEYSLEKVLPLVTGFDLRALQLHSKTGHVIKNHLSPHSIVKTRVRQGRPCYEIKWNKVEGDTITQSEHYITIEDQEAINVCFPDLVSDFEESLAKKKPSKKGKKGVSNAPSSTDLMCQSCSNQKEICTCHLSHSGQSNSEIDIVNQLQELSLNTSSKKSHFSHPHKHFCDTEIEAEQIVSSPKRSVLVQKCSATSDNSTQDKLELVNSKSSMSAAFSAVQTRECITVSDNSDTDSEEVDLLPLSERLKLLERNSKQNSSHNPGEVEKKDKAQHNKRPSPVQQLEAKLIDCEIFQPKLLGEDTAGATAPVTYQDTAPVTYQDTAPVTYQDTAPAKFQQDSSGRDVVCQTLQVPPTSFPSHVSKSTSVPTRHSGRLISKDSSEPADLFLASLPIHENHADRLCKSKSNFPGLKDPVKDKICGSHTEMFQSSLLSFLHDDEDSCLFVFSDEDSDNPAVSLIYDVKSSIVETHKTAITDQRTLQSTSTFSLQENFQNEIAKPKRRSILELHGTDLPNVATPGIYPKHNTVSPCIQTRSRSTPFSTSQIGQFSLDLSLGSNMSAGNDSLQNGLPDTPIGTPRFVIAASPLLDTNYLSPLPATRGLMDDCDISVEQSPLCLSQRLALRLGASFM